MLEDILTVVGQVTRTITAARMNDVTEELQNLSIAFSPIGSSLSGAVPLGTA